MVLITLENNEIDGFRNLLWFNEFFDILRLPKFVNDFVISQDITNLWCLHPVQ